MERTNWKFGITHIHFLLISCIVGKVSVPLLWMVLPASTKRGNSSTSHRITRTFRLLEILPAKDIRAQGRERSRQNVFGMRLQFASKKRAGDSHLMVISDRLGEQSALRLYRKRWGIERLFGHFKKKGFDLEATHMSNASKLEKLFAVLVVAFLFSFAWGSQLRAIEGHMTAAERRKSLFRQGLEDIVRMFATCRLPAS